MKRDESMLKALRIIFAISALIVGVTGLFTESAYIALLVSVLSLHADDNGSIRIPYKEKSDSGSVCADLSDVLL